MNRARLRSFALAGFVVTLLAGCSDDSAPPPAPSRPKPVVYQLPAAADTAITIAVKAGETIHVTTTGTVCTNPGGPVADCDLWTDANGIPSCHYVDWWQCHDLPFMALIGRRSGSHHDYFLVGTDYSETWDSDGEMRLMINDWILDDNEGAYTVSVSRP